MPSVPDICCFLNKVRLHFKLVKGQMYSTYRFQLHYIPYFPKLDFTIDKLLFLELEN